MTFQRVRITTRTRLARRPRSGVALLIALLAATAFADVASLVSGSVAGIPIAGIRHGQMPVNARHGSDILALAARQPEASRDFHRVLNFVRIQRTYCLWGIVPCSISDESRALAAMRDLLLRMTADGGTPATVDLARRVDSDMIESSTALQFSNYSAAPYDTGTVVRPLWTDVTHPGSLGSLPAMLALESVLFVSWSAKVAVL